MTNYNYSFEPFGDNQSIIRVIKPSGETLILTFSDTSPLQSADDYVNAIEQVMLHHPDGLKEEYFVIFSTFFARFSLEAPVSVRYDLDYEYHRFCSKLMELRQSNGVTIEELAEKVGVSVADLSLIEQGEKPIDLELIIRIVAEFGKRLEIE